MCLSGVMLSEIMKPRLQVQVMKWMLAVPTWREVGWASGEMVLLDFMRSLVSVFLSLSFTLFSVIRVFTSEMHVCIVSDVYPIKTGQDWSSCVLSAKGWLEAEWASVKEKIGAECTGQKNEPYGTPWETATCLELWPLTVTVSSPTSTVRLKPQRMML